jgi:hypothetical protein
VALCAGERRLNFGNWRVCLCHYFSLKEKAMTISTVPGVAYHSDLEGLAAELAAISAPVPLWVCGMPFVLFAGDGGANGMLFTGTAGGFTLSAAVLTGLVIPVGYCYLPANAGGLGNAAGWFYFEMSSSTAGTVYNNGFTPTPGALPVVPTAKTAFANPAGGRITQTTADITMLSCSLAAGAMGANGLLKAGIKMLGTIHRWRENSKAVCRLDTGARLFSINISCS